MDAADQNKAPEPPPPPAATPAPAEVEAVEALHARPRDLTPQVLPLDQIEDDAGFRVRGDGDLSLLATDLARLGQLFPVDVRPVGEDRYQVVSGFRRVAALRFLQREQVVARVHVGLTDDDALLMALAAALHAEPVSAEALVELKDRLEQEGRLSPAARDMIEKALSTDGLSPEGVEEEEEVDADELALDVTARLGEINQDLALLADVFEALDDSRRQELLQQLRYSAELVAFLEGR